MSQAHATDTIVAIATPAGAGGVGIVRVSGPLSLVIGNALAGRTLTARTAHYARFADADGSIIDDGIALAFPAPRSYTGEDVVELQAHGSPVLLQQLVARCCTLGARIARPGEFSERAFLNGKLDLAQAEAVADLIAASDLRAARAARRALDGEFSQRVDAIADALLAIRVHVEAMIDFVDEPIETLGAAQVQLRLAATRAQLSALLADAERGRKLRDGLHAVIVGPPNAGKSSLLNALAGSDRAIVTDIAGTTRDLLTETVRVAGIELTLVDTAGLRDGGDAIEREGMRRARAELQRADLAIIVLDAADPLRGRNEIEQAIAGVPTQLWLLNKIDLQPDATRLTAAADADAADAAPSMLPLSARTGAGLDALRTRLAALAGLDSGSEGSFSARQRQVDSLIRASHALDDAEQAWRQQALDLAAEALHQAHDALGDITGRILPDDLLGHIFSTFCIGK